MNKMLLIVDPQIDFITGSLPVKGAEEAMNRLADYVKTHGNDYSLKIVTADWHPYHHCSFKSQGGQWPVHCVEDSVGAAIWQPLLIALNESRGGYTKLTKGNSVDRDEYSIMQNDHSGAILLKLIKALHIDQIDICGLAGDVCVLNTAKDLKDVLGDRTIHILEEYAPSLDGGKALHAFIETLNA